MYFNLFFILVTQNYCEFYVNAEQGSWGDEMSCAQFCTAEGGSCVDGWRNANDNCDKGNSFGCDHRFRDGICRCSPPASMP